MPTSSTTEWMLTIAIGSTDSCCDGREGSSLLTAHSTLTFEPSTLLHTHTGVLSTVIDADPYTTPIQPLFNPYSTPIQSLFNPYSIPIQSLSNPYSIPI